MKVQSSVNYALDMFNAFNVPQQVDHLQPFFSHSTYQLGPELSISIAICGFEDGGAIKDLRLKIRWLVLWLV